MILRRLTEAYSNFRRSRASPGRGVRWKTNQCGVGKQSLEVGGNLFIVIRGEDTSIIRVRPAVRPPCPDLSSLRHHTPLLSLSPGARKGSRRSPGTEDTSTEEVSTANQKLRLKGVFS